MSRTTAPLLSFGASGQIAKTQVYSTWKGRAYARRYVIPANPNTVAQQSTRNVFRWLNSFAQYLPADSLAAWTAYANSLRITPRNAITHLNLPLIKADTDLANLVLSPAAKGGIAPVSVVTTPGAGQLSVAITEPTLPTGWTITKAFAVAIADQDPHSGTDFQQFQAEDAATPFACVITGLTAAQLYYVGGALIYVKDTGETAYSIALPSSGTPT